MLVRLTPMVGGGDTLVIDTLEVRLKRVRRRLIMWSRAMNEVMAARPGATRALGFCLTYRPDVAWEPGHIRNFVIRMRSKLKSALLGYAWVAELHKSGRVHYHVCIVVSRGVDVPFPDDAGWWVHGMTSVTSIKHASSKYLAKYLQKGSDNIQQFPKGLHIFAVVVRTELPDPSYFFFKISAAAGIVYRRIIFHFYNFLKSGIAEAFPWRKWRWESLPGGGWLLRCGKRFYEVVQSPYVFVGLD